MKPLYFLNSPDILLNRSQVDHYSMSMARFPYSNSNPYNFVGPLGALGQHAIIHAQMAPQILGVVPERIALMPLDLAEDGPIYVNAKQYHGILRRRQCRAKLEAKSKQVKIRKPYLHESRHLHALNRVRGSGGRFLGTKKLQQSISKPVTNSSSGSELYNLYEKKELPEGERNHSKNSATASSITTCSDSTSWSSKSISSLGKPDRSWLGEFP